MSSDYDKIAKKRLEQEKYLLLYARCYNPKMEEYAEKIAAENGWKIIEISLRATNAEKPNRRMFYEGGVEGIYVACEVCGMCDYEFVPRDDFYSTVLQASLCILS